MAKRTRMDEELDQVAALRHARKDDASVEALRQALASRYSLVVESAAIAAKALGATELSDALAGAYDRFYGRHEQDDKGCLAKTACIVALNTFERSDEERLLRGARHIQMEPVFGGSVDVAGLLRGECLAGLVTIGYERAHEIAVDLLIDNEVETRAVAVKALETLGGQEGLLALRLKALVGDKEPSIVGDCLAAMLRRAPVDSLPFVRTQLERRSPPIALEAALALAQTHRPEVLPLLLAVRSARPDEEIQIGLLMPIALLRTDEAYRFLMEVLASERAYAATEAVKALRLYADDPIRRSEIQTEVERRSEASIRRMFELRYRDTDAE
ncbi:hypothetical protein GC173_07520 [bacterium]|nr:hypothetical protein [bacterium]